MKTKLLKQIRSRYAYMWNAKEVEYQGMNYSDKYTALEYELIVCDKYKKKSLNLYRGYTSSYCIDEFLKEVLPGYVSLLRKRMNVREERSRKKHYIEFVNRQKAIHPHVLNKFNNQLQLN